MFCNTNKLYTIKYKYGGAVVPPTGHHAVPTEGQGDDGFGVGSGEAGLAPHTTSFLLGIREMMGWGSEAGIVPPTKSFLLGVEKMMGWGWGGERGVVPPTAPFLSRVR